MNFKTTVWILITSATEVVSFWLQSTFQEMLIMGQATDNILVIFWILDGL